MIPKKLRLKEREVKKVLSRKKPFFSYNIVLNYSKNNFRYSRFAIVIWKKSVKNSVERVFFRRKFYKNIIASYSHTFIKPPVNFDLVFVVKKKTKLDKRDEKSIKDFEKEIDYLLNKAVSNTNNK